MTQEVFKPIPGYEGSYEVSNLGNVKSIKFDKQKLLKTYSNGAGYLQLTLRKNKKPKTYLIHQLVAMAFLGHNPCGHEFVVDHINNIKTDNRLVNLQVISNIHNIWKSLGYHDLTGYTPYLI